MKQTKKLLWILISLIVAIIGVLIVFLVINKNNFIFKKSSKVENNWKSYDNATNKFSLNYPNDWKFFEYGNTGLGIDDLQSALSIGDSQTELVDFKLTIFNSESEINKITNGKSFKDWVNQIPDFKKITIGKNISAYFYQGVSSKNDSKFTIYYFQKNNALYFIRLSYLDTVPEASQKILDSLKFN